MGLIIPKGPSWAYCSVSATTVAASPAGVSVTPGANNADGSAVDLFGGTPLAHDVEYLRLSFNLSSSPSGLINALMAQILIDPAGGSSWATLIPNLVIGGLNVISAGVSGDAGMRYDFPLWIPAGASLGIKARCASAGSVPTLLANVQAYGGNANPGSWWCGQRITDIGTDAANSNGTLHTAGNSGVFSSWTDFGSTLSADCGALQWSIGFISGSSANAHGYHFEFGVAGGIIGPPIFKSLQTNEQGWMSSAGPLFRRLKAGTQFQVRGNCEVTAQALGVAAYAVH